MNFTGTSGGGGGSGGGIFVNCSILSGRATLTANGGAGSIDGTKIGGGGMTKKQTINKK